MNRTNMKRIIIPLLAACFAALPDAGAQVAGLENLSNDHCYTLTRRPAAADSCGIVYYTAEALSEQTEAVSAQAKTGIAESDDSRWAIWHQTADDLYYLYNLGAGKFLSADGSTCPLVSDAVPVELYYLETLSSWLIQCKGFTVGLSPEKSDYTVFLGDLAANGNNGFLFTIDEASRTLTDAEKTTIEAAVMGVRNARIEAYRAFVERAETIARDGRSNYAGTYDYAALKTALADADAKTIEELESLYVAAKRSALPKTGKYYRLHNYTRPTAEGNRLLTVNGKAGNYTMVSENSDALAPGSTSGRAENLRLFRLEATPNDTVFYICATGPNQYFSWSSSGGKLPLVDRTAAIKFRIIDNSDIAGRLFRLQNDDAANRLYLTISGGNELVSYGPKEDSELWYFEEVTAIDGVSIGSSGYATLCLPCPVELPDDLTAYIAAEDRPDEVILKALDTDILPAYTPVVLYREAGAKTYSLPIANAQPEPVSGNLLGGTTARTDLSTADYILANKTQGIGFYRITNESDITLAANKAYLRGAAVANAATNAFRMSFGHGAATGIDAPDTQTPAEGIYYDLSGRRVKSPSQGIFIDSNNRKILIK